MKSRLPPLSPAFLAVAMALSMLGRPAQADTGSASDESVTLPEIRVEGHAVVDPSRLDARALTPLKARETDSARLLDAIPGLSLHGAGGFSALPVLHGAADDRLLIRADGVSVPSSCPNHMNSPLSYIDASKVDSIKVYNGSAPVSVGGDNIGGVVVVDPAAPRFADPGSTLSRGELGGYYRSNGKASGGHIAATVANDTVSLGYTGSTARAGNYTAAKDFKSAGPAASGQGWLNADMVGSSGYKTENHELALALRGDSELLEVKAGVQHSPFEGFPNQRMDMTGNDAYQLSMHFNGRYGWGTLDARLVDQYVRHSMQFGDDKQYTYGSYAGMPMETASHTQGGTLVATLPLTERDTLKLGAELQHYRLDDWWPAAGSSGGMGPNTFWNINNGQRTRFDQFGEIEHAWSDRWNSVFGLRLSQVDMNAGAVQGYNTTSTYATDAAAFNAADRHRTDRNVDLSALVRYAPEAGQRYELAYARKTRSPNLYERYGWASSSMAAVMNNFAGDGNGYFGNPNLKPEVANNLNFSANLSDPDNENWSLAFAPYYSYIQNYIDAERCGSTLCGGSSNLTVTNNYVTLQYVNQNAEIYGADLSGKLALLHASAYGRFDLTGKVSYTRGKNLSTGDNLYNIMPLNAKLALEQALGEWGSALELQLVDAKRDVSRVRNEITTPGYALLNLRGSRHWARVRVDFGIENLLNRYYVDPLGGAYTGQGKTMSRSGIPWGEGVPGPARTFYTSFNYSF
jgi:iron complex outermembrane recepter protein